MTVIAIYGSRGGLIGRCDARCYNADHPQCDCICGGKNHGKGIKSAKENTRKFADDWAAECKADKVETHTEQPEMF